MLIAEFVFVSSLHSSPIVLHLCCGAQTVEPCSRTRSTKYAEWHFSGKRSNPLDHWGSFQSHDLISPGRWSCFRDAVTLCVCACVRACSRSFPARSGSSTQPTNWLDWFSSTYQLSVGASVVAGCLSLPPCPVQSSSSSRCMRRMDGITQSTSSGTWLEKLDSSNITIYIYIRKCFYPDFETF